MIVEAAELAAFLRIDDTIEHPHLDQLLKSSVEAIESHCGQQFRDADTTATARVFRARWCDLLLVAPISSTTDLDVDVDAAGTGTYSEQWAIDTDYTLEPFNQIQSGLTDHPYLAIRAVGSKMFPTTGHRPRVRVTARWGWSTIPSSVRDAVMLHAARLHERRNAPAGIVAGDGFIGRTSLGIDPDVKALVAPFVRHDLLVVR